MTAGAVRYGLIGTGIFVGIFLFIGGAIIGWVVVPGKAKEEISKRAHIKKGNEIYEEWSAPSLPITLKIWLFNYTNPDAIQNGQRAKLQELGPYVYREKRVKVDIKESEDASTISYKENTTFFFDAKASVGREEDVINTPNVPLIALAHQAKAQDIPLADIMIEFLVDDADEPSKLILRGVTVGDVLFKGWKLAKPFEMIPEEDVPPELKGFKFGYFRTMNGTSSKEFVIRTGQNGDSARIGKIMTYDGMKELPWWNTSGLAHDTTHHYCNKINGSDGSLFAPLVTKDRILRMFAYKACRSVSMKFDVETEVQSIPGLKFKMDESYLADPKVHKDEACFCPIQNPELAHYCDKGFLRIWPCAKGVPLVNSHPHFMEGSPDLFKPVEITPAVKDKHESYLVLEPNTGFPIAGHSRAQVNVEVQKLPGFKLFENLDFSKLTQKPSVILPIFWVDESFEFDEKFGKKMYDKLVMPMKLVDGFKWTAVVVGPALTIVSGVFLGRALRH